MAAMHRRFLNMIRTIHGVILACGNKRFSAVTFVYQDKAYLVTGINSGASVNNFWVFDPAAGDKLTLNRISNFSRKILMHISIL
jgi:hypothetical protein